MRSIYRLVIPMVGAVLVIGRAQCEDRQPLLLPSIIKVWKEREARFRTWDFHCFGTEFQKPHFGKPEKFSYSVSMRILCDAAKRLRFEDSAQDWSSKHKRLVPSCTIITSDHKGNKTYWPENEIKSGHIATQATISVFARDLRISPVMVHFRPLDRDIGLFRREKLRLLSRHAQVAGKKCHVLQDRRYLIYVSPSPDFLPLRITVLGNQSDFPDYKIEIDYDQNRQFGWLPAAWVYTVFDIKGRICRERKIQVSEQRINTALGDSDFDVQFDSYTWVQDYPKKESFVLLPNGEKRHIVDVKQYYEIVNFKNRTNYWWIGGIILAAVMLVAGVVVYRRRKRLAGAQRSALPQPRHSSAHG